VTIGVARRGALQSKDRDRPFNLMPLAEMLPANDLAVLLLVDVPAA
jgi:hypothetical protein